MTTPCHDQSEWFDPPEDLRPPERRRRMKLAAEGLCPGCPVLGACRRLGRGEEDGVWGGLLPSDPQRVAYRRAVDKTLMCKNGHLREGNQFPIFRFQRREGEQPLEIWGCQLCEWELKAFLELVDQRTESAA